MFPDSKEWNSCLWKSHYAYHRYKRTVARKIYFYLIWSEDILCIRGICAEISSTERIQVLAITELLINPSSYYLSKKPCKS